MPGKEREIMKRYLHRLVVPPWCLPAIHQPKTNNKPQRRQKENKMNHSTNQKKDSNKSFRNAGILIAVLLVIAVILGLFRSCSTDPVVDDPSGSGLVYDSGAV
mgnify:CR=1 FL=1